MQTWKCRFIALALALCPLLLTGCDSNKEPYEEAVALYKGSDFAAAKAKFESIPTDYKETSLYLAAFDAIDAYEADDWPKAAGAFYSIYDRMEKWANEGVRFSPGFYLISYAYPFIDRISEIRSEKDAPYFLKNTNAWGIYSHNAYSSSWDRFGENMLLESFYLYYDEQARQGVEISSLTDFPLSAVTTNFDRWTRFRTEKANDEVKASDALAAFYQRTDTSVSPVEVTGTGLYVCLNDNAPNWVFDSRSTSGINLDLKGYLSPFHYADAPQNIRYVLNITQTYSKYGTYTDQTIAYRVDATVTIKDVLTGQALFSGHYVANPQSSVTDKEVRAGVIDYGPDGTIFNNDILPALAKLYPILK